MTYQRPFITSGSRIGFLSGPYTALVLAMTKDWRVHWNRGTPFWSSMLLYAESRQLHILLSTACVLSSRRSVGSRDWCIAFMVSGRRLTGPFSSCRSSDRRRTPCWLDMRIRRPNSTTYGANDTILPRLSQAVIRSADVTTYILAPGRPSVKIGWPHSFLEVMQMISQAGQR